MPNDRTPLDHAINALRAQRAGAVLRHAIQRPQPNVVKEVSSKDTDTQSSDNGEIIKSQRTFGIEYEVNFDYNKRPALHAHLGDKYNLVNDGTIRNGVEVVSPILRGKAGEKQVYHACKQIALHGGKTDETCGLHVHFGAQDFFKKVKRPITTLQNAIKEAGSKQGAKKTYCIIHDSVIRKLLRDGNQEIARKIRQNVALNYVESDTFKKALRKCRASGVLISNPEGELINNNRFVIYYCQIGNGLPMGIYQNRSRTQDFYSAINKYVGKPVFINYPDDNVVVNANRSKYLHVFVDSSNDENIHSVYKLKRLAAFYLAFDDVLASMMPLDRRENDYARRANQRISFEELRDIETLPEFLTAWFRFTREQQLLEARPDGRPRARYCGLNLFALLKLGTIEVRYLGGTIDPKEILYWVTLHHKIIDLSADTKDLRGSLKALQKASLVVSLKGKTDLFFSKLGLPKEIEEYYRSLIDKYKDDDKLLVEECLEEDQEFIKTPKEDQLEEEDLDIIDQLEGAME